MDNIGTPDTRKLRSFGLITGLIVAFLFGVMPRLRGAAVPSWPWAVAIPLMLAALVIPRALRGLYAVWMRIGHALGAVNTRIMLGVLFFLVFTPAGLVMRVIGRDPLARRTDRRALSYRVLPGKDQPSSMEVPF